MILRPGTSPEILMEFMPSSPPKGSGWHRYVFLAFAKEYLENDSILLTKPKKRAHFHIAKYIQENQLG